MITIKLEDDGQRQLILLSLAVMSLRSPGFYYALSMIADGLQGPMFEQFRLFRSEDTKIAQLPDVADAPGLKAAEGGRARAAELSAWKFRHGARGGSRPRDRGLPGDGGGTMSDATIKRVKREIKDVRKRLKIQASLSRYLSPAKRKKVRREIAAVRRSVTLLEKKLSA